MAASTISIRVDGPEQAAHARRAATRLAEDIHFDTPGSARAALIAVECANNLWKHGGGGEILLSAVPPDAPAELEILALDHGPGMGDVSRCFQDGYSTAGTLGAGLGAVGRLSSYCEVYSAGGKGTALLARLKNPAATTHGNEAHIGAVSVPKLGETESGDGFAIGRHPDFTTIMVVDGLGHGSLAAECPRAAISVFPAISDRSPVEMLQRVHNALRHTRGAAVAVARLDFRKRDIRFAGIGNIGGFVDGLSQRRQFVSQPGIVGHSISNVREFTYVWPEGSLVLLYSDGISTHWSLDSYQGLRGRDPSLVAGVVYRDWNRGRDDATIVVIRDKLTA